MVRVALALLAGAAMVAVAGLAAGAPSLRTATAACPYSSFTVAFDPKRQVVVRSEGHMLGSASFTSRTLGAACRRVREPKAFRDGGLGREIRSRLGFRCATNGRIRVHVNPIRDESGAIVGSNLSVGLGDPLRVIVSAVLKNKGDPYASRIYRASEYCKLGAR